MFAQLGFTELLILLAVFILIFGVGRIGKLGGELGSGIRAFRRGIREPEDIEELVDQQDKA